MVKYGGSLVNTTPVDSWLHTDTTVNEVSVFPAAGQYFCVYP